jgi:hypothetical protein
MWSTLWQADITPRYCNPSLSFSRSGLEKVLTNGLLVKSPCTPYLVVEFTSSRISLSSLDIAIVPPVTTPIYEYSSLFLIVSPYIPTYNTLNNDSKHITSTLTPLTLLSQSQEQLTSNNTLNN